MSLNSANVRVGTTGAVRAAPLGAPAPTSATSAVATHVDLGWVSEEGVTRTMPGSGDSEAIKGWQNGATIRTIRTPSEDNPTYSFTLYETKIEVIEFVLGVTVTSSATEGHYDIDTTAVRKPHDVVIDVVDDSHLLREHLPRAVVVEVGDTVYSNGEVIGYEVTLEAEYDAALGYNARVFSTDLKTPA